MSSDEFRRHGHQMVDWIAAYLESVGERPVCSAVAPGWVRAQLPAHAPEQGEPWPQIMADVDRVVMPGITHWQSPHFFAYFPANISAPSILGELLSAGLGVQGMLWATSPACTELETHMLDWMAELLGLPPEFRSSGSGGGVIQDTASSAVLCALLAARDAASMRERAAGRRPVAYCTSHSHSSVVKAMRIAGLGEASLRHVPTRADHSMDPDAFARMVQQDIGGGGSSAAPHDQPHPFFCCATVGTTSSHAVDPVAELAPTCAAHGIWLHVDAAHLGTAALCPEFRSIHRGVEHADSYCVNPHKWMLVNFDCSLLWVRDRGALTGALGVLPEYLRNTATEGGGVIDYRDWQIPLGRRFRALKLWFVIRHYGAEGLRALVRHHVSLAQRFRAHVQADGRFQVVAPSPWSLVCFRLRGSDQQNQDLLARVNASGRAYISHTRLDGQYVLRFSVGAASVQDHHIDAAWEEIAGCLSPTSPTG